MLLMCSYFWAIDMFHIRLFVFICMWTHVKCKQSEFPLDLMRCKIHVVFGMECMQINFQNCREILLCEQWPKGKLVSRDCTVGVLRLWDTGWISIFSELVVLGISSYFPQGRFMWEKDFRHIYCSTEPTVHYKLSALGFSEINLSPAARMRTEVWGGCSEIKTNSISWKAGFFFGIFPKTITRTFQ